MSEDYHYSDTERRESVALVPNGSARLLDVGCGRGGFGAAVKRAHEGIEVWGIEPHPTAAEQAKARLDHVVCGTFPDALPANAAGQGFDVISFLDVLEHLVDPWEVLRGSHRLLRDDGVVIASIPNIRHHSVSVPLIARGRWDYDESGGILDTTHLRFFTKATIRELFTTAGYRLVRMVPLIEKAALRRSKTSLAIRLMPSAVREEFLTVQYGVVAKVA